MIVEHRRVGRAAGGRRCDVAELPTAIPLRELWDAATHHYSIRLTCRRCGHSRVLHAAALWWLFHRKGWAARFRDVRRRMFCAMCWARRHERLHGPDLDLVRDEPTDTSIPLPSELDWKRELRRRR